MRKLKYFIQVKSLGLYINFLYYINPKKALALTYQLFSTPRDGKLSGDSLPKFLQDSDMEIISDKSALFQLYKWHGDENVILLVHGWESNASRWEKLLPHLKASGSTIIALDAPAHGLSAGSEFNVPQYAGFINILAKKFKLKALIGHSLGGAACVYYQHKYQNPDLKKMVLLGAPSDLEVLVGNYVKLLGLNRAMARLLDNYFFERFGFRPPEFSGRIFTEKFDIKGMVVHDPDDRIVSFIEARKIAGSWKSAEFIETSGLGHALHDAVLYKRIALFLAG